MVNKKKPAIPRYSSHHPASSDLDCSNDVMQKTSSAASLKRKPRNPDRGKTSTTETSNRRGSLDNKQQVMRRKTTAPEVVTKHPTMSMTKLRYKGTSKLGLRKSGSIDRPKPNMKESISSMNADIKTQDRELAHPTNTEHGSREDNTKVGADKRGSQIRNLIANKQEEANPPDPQMREIVNKPDAGRKENTESQENESPFQKTTDRGSIEVIVANKEIKIDKPDSQNKTSVERSSFRDVEVTSTPDAPTDRTINRQDVKTGAGAEKQEKSEEQHSPIRKNSDHDLSRGKMNKKDIIADNPDSQMKSSDNKPDCGEREATSDPQTKTAINKPDVGTKKEAMKRVNVEKGRSPARKDSNHVLTDGSVADSDTAKKTGRIDAERDQYEAVKDNSESTRVNKVNLEISKAEEQGVQLESHRPTRSSDQSMISGKSADPADRPLPNTIKQEIKTEAPTAPRLAESGDTSLYVPAENVVDRERTQNSPEQKPQDQTMDQTSAELHSPVYSNPRFQRELQELILEYFPDVAAERSLRSKEFCSPVNRASKPKPADSVSSSTSNKPVPPRNTNQTRNESPSNAERLPETRQNMNKEDQFYPLFYCASKSSEDDTISSWSSVSSCSIGNRSAKPKILKQNIDEHLNNASARTGIYSLDYASNLKRGYARNTRGQVSVTSSTGDRPAPPLISKELRGEYLDTMKHLADEENYITGNYSPGTSVSTSSWTSKYQEGDTTVSTSSCTSGPSTHIKPIIPQSSYQTSEGFPKRVEHSSGVIKDVYSPPDNTAYYRTIGTRNTSSSVSSSTDNKPVSPQIPNQTHKECCTKMKQFPSKRKTISRCHSYSPEKSEDDTIKSLWGSISSTSTINNDPIAPQISNQIHEEYSNTTKQFHKAPKCIESDQFDPPIDTISKFRGDDTTSVCNSTPSSASSTPHACGLCIRYHRYTKTQKVTLPDLKADDITITCDSVGSSSTLFTESAKTQISNQLRGDYSDCSNRPNHAHCSPVNLSPSVGNTGKLPTQISNKYTPNGVRGCTDKERYTSNGVRGKSKRYACSGNIISSTTRNNLGTPFFCKICKGYHSYLNAADVCLDSERSESTVGYPWLRYQSP